MLDKVKIQNDINESGINETAKKYGMSYTSFLRLRKKLKLSVWKGSNQHNQFQGYRWSKLKPFDVITNNYYRAYKASAKRREHDFYLSLVDFKKLCKSACFYCGKLRIRVVKVQNRFYRTKINGIDRVNNLVGYITENCVPCCSICNYAKRKMSTSEFISWLEDVKNFKIKFTVMETLLDRNRNRC